VEKRRKKWGTLEGLDKKLKMEEVDAQMQDSREEYEKDPAESVRKL